MDGEYEQFSKHMEETYPKMFAGQYGGFCVDAGWWPIIERLCRQIQTRIDWQNGKRQRLLERNEFNDRIPDEVEQVVVAQIKEKFGGLRFYYDGGDDYISGLVSMAEAWADNTCEVCGNRGHSRGGSWVKTLCDVHDQERRLEQFGNQ